MTDPTIARSIEVLKSAKALLVLDGWTQGSYLNDEGRMCANGALYWVEGHYYSGSGKHLIETVREITNDQYIGVESWNDQPGRTVEEVLDMYDKTIARLEGMIE
ncbi:hypothetical protein [Nocardia sp. NPDC057440]|uniref:DUF6197 family protein n=1 Tax=Nocardia sp. NPDC057440 TaxID=3346134 RepID=UPI003671F1E4